MRRSPPLVLALLLLLLPGIAAAQPLTARRGLPQDEGYAQRQLDLLGPEHLLREALRVTRGRYYDRAARDDEARWEALRARWSPEAAGARSPAALYEVVNRMLGELGVSHLALLERAVYERELAGEFRAVPSVRLGAELVLLDGRLFLDGVTHGSPADAAGLRDGDEVVTIDGLLALGHASLEGAGHDPGLPGPPGFFLRPPGDLVTLGVREAADAEVTPVEVALRPTSMVDAVRASARVVEVDGRRVGVIRLWHFMTMAVAERLEEALSGPLSSVDALVLDVRGRGGHDAVVRRVLGLFHGRRARWDRPVVVLTSEGTRSAKEIFAYHWKRAARGPVVGERTQGACLGCTFTQLSDGSILMVPVVDVRRLTGGEVLEGRGVEPDVLVRQLPLPFRGGRDAILEAGLREAATLAAPEPARSF
ncbi:MAG: S41 family peptidase [Planctomycetes bacterium]|nr:S41 family peptidase [Planctomycetota bacterium]